MFVWFLFLLIFNYSQFPREAQTFRSLSVWTGCLIRTKPGWHFFNICPCSLFVRRSQPEQLIMSTWQRSCGLFIHMRDFFCFCFVFIFIRNITVWTWILQQTRSGQFHCTCSKPTSKAKSPNVAVHHFPSGCKIHPDQTWHNKHLFLQELHNAFLHLSVQIQLSVGLKTQTAKVTNKTCRVQVEFEPCIKFENKKVNQPKCSLHPN